MEFSLIKAKWLPIHPTMSPKNQSQWMIKERSSSLACTSATFRVVSGHFLESSNFFNECYFSFFKLLLHGREYMYFFGLKNKGLCLCFQNRRYWEICSFYLCFFFFSNQALQINYSIQTVVFCKNFLHKFDESPE